MFYLLLFAFIVVGMISYSIFQDRGGYYKRLDKWRKKNAGKSRKRH